METALSTLPVRKAMFDLDRFLTACHEAVASSAPPVAVREVVRAAVSTPSQIAGALGAPRESGLHVLHRSPALTVLNVVWTPGMAIYPHDHRMWAVIGLYGGREDNTFYRRGAGSLVVAGQKRLERSDTALLGDGVIHAVANPLREFTGAIHVYGGDFFAVPRSEWTPDTLVERPFDIDRARQVYADANERWKREAG
jgi:predicted metal-dependent enzyme (double-stranded beta helix superfamily)